MYAKLKIFSWTELPLHEEDKKGNATSANDSEINGKNIQSVDVPLIEKNKHVESKDNNVTT